MYLTQLIVAFGVSIVNAGLVFDFDNEGCTEKPLELVFLLDSSSSIWSVDFQKQLGFVNEVIDQFDISPNTTRVGVASFSYSYRTNIDLTQSINKDVVKAKVSTIHQLYGGTYTDVALTGLRTQGLSQSISRPGVPRIAIVLTDGESHNSEKTKQAAIQLKEDGVTVFAIGVGSKSKEHELRVIASEPAEKYRFKVDSYGLLRAIKSNLTRYACQDVNDEQKKIPVCGNNNAADIMFLVNPTHLGYNDSRTIYQFISDVSNEFNMANGNIRVGLESQICPSGDVRLRRVNTRTQSLGLFGSHQFKGINHMLKRLRTNAYRSSNGGRIGARHMAVLFIDDKLYNTKQLLDEARRTKHNDVELFVVAIGDNVNERELKTLCSSSVDRHYIRVPSYGHLQSIQSDFLEKFCHGL